MTGKIIEEYISSLSGKESKKTSSIREISNMLKEGITIPENINYKEFITGNPTRIIKNQDYKEYPNNKR